MTTTASPGGGWVAALRSQGRCSSNFCDNPLRTQIRRRETHQRLVWTESLMESGRGAGPVKPAARRFIDAFATQLGKSATHGVVGVIVILVLALAR